MTKIFFLLAILYTIMMLLWAPANAAIKPAHGHPFHALGVRNFVRHIDESPDLKIIVPDWYDVLQRQFIRKKSGIQTLVILKQINDSINSKQSFDYAPWMTPEEFYQVKVADCKGYAVAKYYALRAAGWSEDDLNLWSGDYDGKAHLILVARVDGRQYVLDIMDQSLPEAINYFYGRFVPSYRFNEVGLDIE